MFTFYRIPFLIKKDIPWFVKIIFGQGIGFYTSQRQNQCPTSLAFHTCHVNQSNPIKIWIKSKLFDGSNS